MGERERENQIIIQRRGRKPAPLRPWVYYRNAKELADSVRNACRSLEQSMGITPPDHVEILGAWQECRGRFLTDNVEYRFAPVKDRGRPDEDQARPAADEKKAVQSWPSE